LQVRALRERQLDMSCAHFDEIRTMSSSFMVEELAATKKACFVLICRLGLFIGPESGGIKLLRNYASLQLTRRNSLNMFACFCRLAVRAVCYPSVSYSAPQKKLAVAVFWDMTLCSLADFY
jgi:hypothetical protein